MASIGDAATIRRVAKQAIRLELQARLPELSATEIGEVMGCPELLPLYVMQRCGGTGAGDLAAMERQKKMLEACVVLLKAVGRYECAGE